jgi:hypothetical protein
MHYMVLCFLYFLTQSAFALDMAQTKYGRLEIKSIGEYEKGLFFESKVLFKRESGYLVIEKVFHVGSSEIVLVRNGEGGAGTIDAYFFVNLMPNSQPILSKEFMAQGSEIIPILKGNKITIDLGYNEGVHEILTYQNGNQSIEKIREKVKNKAGNEDNCNYLYNNIYVAYVQERECNKAPEEVSGQATARPYYSISNDPHFHLKLFQNLSKASCKNGEWIKYSEFKKKVCRG